MKATKELVEKTCSVTYKSTIGIYFLMDGDEIVYIGKTINGLKRISSHIGNKDFENVLWFDMFGCNDDELSRAEIDFIREYNPKYNVHQSKSERIKPSRKQDIYTFAVSGYAYKRIAAYKYENKLYLELVKSEDEHEAIEYIEKKAINDGYDKVCDVSCVYVGDSIAYTEREVINFAKYVWYNKSLSNTRQGLVDYIQEWKDMGCNYDGK